MRRRTSLRARLRRASLALGGERGTPKFRTTAPAHQSRASFRRRVRRRNARREASCGAAPAGVASRPVAGRVGASARFPSCCVRRRPRQPGSGQQVRATAAAQRAPRLQRWPLCSCRSVAAERGCADPSRATAATLRGLTRHAARAGRCKRGHPAHSPPALRTATHARRRWAAVPTGEWLMLGALFPRQLTRVAAAATSPCRPWASPCRRAQLRSC